MFDRIWRLNWSQIIAYTGAKSTPPRFFWHMSHEECFAYDAVSWKFLTGPFRANLFQVRPETYLVGLAMDSLKRQAPGVGNSQWQPFGHWKVKGNFLYRPLFIWETHNGSCGWSHLHHFSGPQRRVSVGNALKQSGASDFKFRACARCH